MRQLSGSNWKLWRRDTNEFGFARPDYFLTEPLSFGITDPVPKGTFSCCYDVAWLDASQACARPPTAPYDPALMMLLQCAPFPCNHPSSLILLPPL